MFAVIKSGGRQYKVAVGEQLEVNRLPVRAGEQVRFSEVLLISDAENTLVGTPLLEDALVLATATKQGRGEKLIVFKYKPKKRYRHKRGHRQELTFLTIEDIVANGKSLITGEPPVFREFVEPLAEDEEIEETEDEETEESAEENETEAVAESTAEKRTRRRRAVKTEEDEDEDETPAPAPNTEKAEE